MPRKVSDGVAETWAEYEKRINADFRRNGFEKHCASSGVGEVTAREVAEFRAVLTSAQDEKPLQEYLTAHPSLIASEIGPQCRWVIPHPRLGGEYIPDFIVARLDSGGVKWTLIELETPVIESLFIKDGSPRKQLAKGVRQVGDWRSWLEDNLDKARRPRRNNGLGLVDIHPQAPGVVIIGRADDRTEDDRSRLIRRLEREKNIEVWSYDRLIREAERRIAFLEAYGSPNCEECGTA